MNILKLIGDASIIVQMILMILVFFSVFSWAIILFKRKSLRSGAAHSRRFLNAFHEKKNLAEVGEAARKYKLSPLAALFRSGFKELAYLTKSNPNPGLTAEKIEILSRALQKASNQEIAKMESMMSFLATTGSVTPFIGLFGTVWGIMDAFTRIGIVRSASLVTVAPGIAEALIATAVGLFAAVPAVIAYNYFLGRIKDVITEMEDFTFEFIGIVERLYGS
jgi:biopolymer transport protein TolQ